MLSFHPASSSNEKKATTIERIRNSPNVLISNQHKSHRNV